MYYLGQDTTAVKPVTRRTTWTRPMFNQLRTQQFLMKKGRCPSNRKAYPTAGVPVGVHKVPGWGQWQRRLAIAGQKKPDAFSAPRPGWFGAMQTALMKARAAQGPAPRPGRPLSAFFTRPTMGHYLNTDMHLAPGRQLGTPVLLDMHLEPGGQLGGLTDFFSVPALTSSFTPAPAATTVSAGSSVWSPIAGLVNLWNERPQVLKDIKIKVDPNTVMRTMQSVVSPGQVSSAVNKLQQWGVNLDYKGMPVGGQTAGLGYQLAGVNWSQYMPWIIGGGVALLALPLLMGKR